MRQGSAKQVVSALKQKQKKTDISYQTKVVGGVVQRIPVQVRTGWHLHVHADVHLIHVCTFIQISVSG